MEKYRKGRHSTFLLNVHLVFVTKYRRKIFDTKAIERLIEHFEGVCNGLNCDLNECDGASDHIHLIVSMSPTVSVAVLVNALKGASSRMLRKERKDLKHAFFKNVLWSRSYFACSTGGASLDVIKCYVQQQRKGTVFPPPPKGGSLHTED